MTTPRRAGPAPTSPRGEVKAATERDDLPERVSAVTAALLAAMGVPGEVVCRDRRADDTPHVWVEILSTESRALIGEHGRTLAAFEHILRRCLRSALRTECHIIADVNAYRLHRMEAVRRTARASAQRARQTGRAVVLRPMRASERRLVHLALATEAGVATESIGQEPLRRVVIRPVDSLF